jgi:hypothetical protein
MATNRRPIQHPHRGRLSHMQEMVLRYGPDERWADAFCDEEEHRDAWIRNRDRLLASCRGHRPAAWWRYEAGDLPYPGYEREQSTLYEVGVLGEEERDELVKWWHEQYLRAQAANFWHYLGPGRSLQGAPARRAHYRWADIPASLLAEWSAAHRRRGKTVRKLETAAAEQPEPAA